jgi:hypothetical protein
VYCQVLTHNGVGILDEALSDRIDGALPVAGRYRVTCELPPVLTPGAYAISIWLGTPYDHLEHHENVVTFSVEGDDLGRVHRLVKLGMNWSTARLDDHLDPGGPA